MKTDWTSYPSPGFHDELVGPGGGARAAGRQLMRYLTEMDGDEIAVRQQAAELAIKVMGITFTVYHEQDGSIDRSWPLDIIPRTISRKEWQKIEAGLIQRAAALNLFIDDVYHDQKFIKDGLMPASIIATSKNFRANVRGIKPPLRTWAHICGSDLIRDKDGTVYVLEDNLRVPSGVSYMLENRQVVKRVFPELFESAAILPVDDYPSQLYDMLSALSPRKETRPEVVVLTPGIYNSAYFEHAYLARQMGCELVEGRDLAVDSDDVVYMQTVRGWERVDVIYRRIDDDFLDQECFRKDSSLGVPGLMRAWAAGKGYQGVFLRTLNAQALVFTATFAFSFLFLFFNLKVARQSLSRPQFVLGTTEDGRPIVVESRSISNLLLPAALIVSIALGFSASNNWLEWLSALNAVAFGDRDVLFGRDVAFYVFRMPVLDLVREQGLVLVVLALAASGVLYLLSGSVLMEPRYGVAFWPRLNLTTTARRHLSLLLTLLFALMAWGIWLELPRTLITGSATNVVFGASYADVYARVPFLRVSLVVMALASFLALWQAFAPQRWLLPLAIGSYLVISLAGSVYTSFVQRFVVTPNESTSCTPGTCR
jgi:hypothetical protein